ncbi:hypothetical protein DFH06DRAFT_617678 [Mycena polygramma]|nr:hypothetical protein DFH06DRAFT_617678 [Mycena polygramma]
MPSRKDRFHIVFIHEVPQHLSTEDFERKLEALVDCAVALPAFQDNLLKVEMLFQNDKLDAHVGAYGFGPRQEMVLVAMQSETAEHLFAVLSDPEVRSVFEKGKEFSLHGVSCGLAADILPKIDKPSPPGCTHFVCVYKAPTRVVSKQQHDHTMDEFLTALVALPGLEKNFVNFEVWRNNEALDDHIRAFGYSAAGTTFVLRADTESMDNALEILTDPEGQKMMETAESKGLAFKTDGYLFHVDVVTKLEKA